MTLSFACAAPRNLPIWLEEQKGRLIKNEKDTGSRRSQHVERGAQMGELWGKADTGLDQ